MQGDEVAIPIIFFITAMVVGVIALTTRHRERMAVITKGLGSEEIKALYTSSFRPTNPLTSLKWGILLVFGGLAVLVGNFLHSHFMVDESVIVGLVCLFAGFALLLFYMIAVPRLRGAEFPWRERQYQEHHEEPK